jgi:hypothetical protein
MLGDMNDQDIDTMANELGVKPDALRSALERMFDGVSTSKLSKGLSKRAIDVRTEHVLKETICGRTPLEVELGERPWDKNAVGQLASRLLNKDLPDRTLAGYMRRWGFAPERPLHTFYRERPESIRKWMKEVYPSISKLAKMKGAELYWCASSDLVQSSGAPMPASDGSRKDLIREMVFLSTNKGEMYWLVANLEQVHTTVIHLLELMLRYRQKPIVVCMDDKSTLLHSKVRRWFEEHTTQCTVYFLTSPE